MSHQRAAWQRVTFNRRDIHSGGRNGSVGHCADSGGGLGGPTGIGHGRGDDILARHRIQVIPGDIPTPVTVGGNRPGSGVTVTPVDVGGKVAGGTARISICKVGDDLAGKAGAFNGCEVDARGSQLCIGNRAGVRRQHVVSTEPGDRSSHACRAFFGVGVRTVDVESTAAIGGDITRNGVGRRTIAPVDGCAEVRSDRSRIRVAEVTDYAAKGSAFRRGESTVDWSNNSVVNRRCQAG